LQYWKLSKIPNIKFAKVYIDSLMDHLIGSKSLIIDLRENLGGADGFAQYLASYFLPKNTKLFSRTFKNRNVDIYTQTVDATKGHKELPIFICFSR